MSIPESSISQSQGRKPLARLGAAFVAGMLAAAGLIFLLQPAPKEEPPAAAAPAFDMEAWTRKGPIPASGGKFFQPRLVLPVPHFRQNDPVWGADLLGPAPDETLGSHGCAVTSAAMVLASYGVQTNPRALNEFLKTNDGFTPEAWLKWEVAAELDPERARFVYEDLPSYQLIDENLSRGNPVIVRLRYGNGGTTHFVVICGKDGYDYLTLDPGRGAEKGVYPLKEFGSDIEALRFYERATPPPPPAP